jgi:hypothetical protein
MAAPSFLEISQSLLFNNHPRMEIHYFGNLNCGGKKACRKVIACYKTYVPIDSTSN